MSRLAARSTALTTVLLGGLVLLLAAGRTWFTVRARGGIPLPPVHLSGRDLAAGVPALGLVSLAGCGGLIAARGALRRVVGGVLVLTGTAAAALTVTRGLLPAARDAARTTAARSLAGADGLATRGSAWPVVALLGALLVVAAGALAVRYGALWSTLGARYDAPVVAGGAVARRPARTDWDALDHGEDPTSG